MKFKQTIDTNLKNFGLKRIRIKFDPLNKTHETYRAYNSYEGYVLEEDEKTVSVFVINSPEELDPFINVPHDMVNSSPKLDQLKGFIAEKLNSNIKIVNMIRNVNDIVSIETILKDNGISDTCLKDMYREYILS
jgi:hypothetical protein